MAVQHRGKDFGPKKITERTSLLPEARKCENIEVVSEIGQSVWRDLHMGRYAVKIVAHRRPQPARA